MWVARDKDGTLKLYLYTEPWKTEYDHWFGGSGDGFEINHLSSNFKDVSWDDKKPFKVLLITDMSQS